MKTVTPILADYQAPGDPDPLGIEDFPTRREGTSVRTNLSHFSAQGRYKWREVSILDEMKFKDGLRRASRFFQTGLARSGTHLPLLLPEDFSAWIRSHEGIESATVAIIDLDSKTLDGRRDGRLDRDAVKCLMRMLRRMSAKARCVLFYDFDGFGPVALPLPVLDPLAFGCRSHRRRCYIPRFQAGGWLPLG